MDTNLLTEFRDQVIDRLARIEEGVAGQYPKLLNLENRVAGIERWRWMVLGAFACITGTATYLGHQRFYDLVNSAF